MEEGNWVDSWGVKLSACNGVLDDDMEMGARMVRKRRLLNCKSEEA